MALTRCGSHVSTRLFVRPRLGITTSAEPHRRRMAIADAPHVIAAVF